MLQNWVLCNLVAISAMPVTIEDNIAPPCTCCSDLCNRIWPFRSQTYKPLPTTQPEFSFREALLQTFPTAMSIGAPSIFSVHTSDFRTFEAFPTLRSVMSESMESTRFDRTKTITKALEIKVEPLPSLISPSPEPFFIFEVNIPTTVEDFASAFLDTNSPVGCAKFASKESNIKNLVASNPVMEGTVTTVNIENKIAYAMFINFSQKTILQFHLRQLGPSRLTKLSTTTTPVGTSISREHLDLEQTQNNQVTVKYYIQCTGDGQTGTPDNLKECIAKNMDFVKRYIENLRKYFS